MMKAIIFLCVIVSHSVFANRNGEPEDLGVERQGSFASASFDQGPSFNFEDFRNVFEMMRNRAQELSAFNRNFASAFDSNFGPVTDFRSDFNFKPEVDFGPDGEAFGKFFNTVENENNLSGKGNYGVVKTFVSSSSNVNGKRVDEKKASVLINDNGKIKTYNYQS